MGFSVEYSGVIITHALHKATLLVVAIRWVMCMALKHMGLCFNNSSDEETHTVGSSSCCSSSSPSAQMIRDSLQVATYSEVSRRLPGGGGRTCAVCLTQLWGNDKVWELRNCCHVFHKRCLDRWLDHDEHKTCPLCRAPLMCLPSSSSCPDPAQPSWAVERILYLFGDDLLFT